MLKNYLQYCFNELEVISHKQRLFQNFYQPSSYLQMLLLAQLKLTRTMSKGFRPHSVVAQPLKCFWCQLLPTDWQSTHNLHLPFNAKKGFTSLLSSCTIKLLCREPILSIFFLLACLLKFVVRASQPITITIIRIHHCLLL